MLNLRDEILENSRAKSTVTTYKNGILKFSNWLRNYKNDIGENIYANLVDVSGNINLDGLSADIISIYLSCYCVKKSNEDAVLQNNNNNNDDILNVVLNNNQHTMDNYEFKTASTLRNVRSSIVYLYEIEDKKIPENIEKIVRILF